MKNVKVTVTKSIDKGAFTFHYPTGYDAEKVVVDGYEHFADPNKIGETEFLFGRVGNDFPFASDMVQLNDADYATELAKIAPK